MNLDPPATVSALHLNAANPTHIILALLQAATYALVTSQNLSSAQPAPSKETSFQTSTSGNVSTETPFQTSALDVMSTETQMLTSTGTHELMSSKPQSSNSTLFTPSLTTNTLKLSAPAKPPAWKKALYCSSVLYNSNTPHHAVRNDMLLNRSISLYPSACCTASVAGMVALCFHRSSVIKAVKASKPVQYRLGVGCICSPLGYMIPAIEAYDQVIKNLLIYKSNESGLYTPTVTPQLTYFERSAWKLPFTPESLAKSNFSKALFYIAEHLHLDTMVIVQLLTRDSYDDDTLPIDYLKPVKLQRSSTLLTVSGLPPSSSEAKYKSLWKLLMLTTRTVVLTGTKRLVSRLLAYIMCDAVRPKGDFAVILATIGSQVGFVQPASVCQSPVTSYNDFLKVVIFSSYNPYATTPWTDNKNISAPRWRLRFYIVADRCHNKTVCEPLEPAPVPALETNLTDYKTVEPMENITITWGNGTTTPPGRPYNCSGLAQFSPCRKSSQDLSAGNHYVGLIVGVVFAIIIVAFLLVVGYNVARNNNFTLQDLKRNCLIDETNISWDYPPSKNKAVLDMLQAFGLGEQAETTEKASDPKSSPKTAKTPEVAVLTASIRMPSEHSKIDIINPKSESKYIFSAITDIKVSSQKPPKVTLPKNVKAVRYSSDPAILLDISAPTEGFALTKKTARELDKRIRLKHENLVSFYGIRNKPPECQALFELCDKGNLSRLLRVSKLDWTLQVLLIFDLAKAMNYIHRSYLKCHGCLRTEHCVIDDRFSLKVALLRLPQLSSSTKIGTVSSKDEAPERRKFNQLWEAPELLRHQIQQADKPCDVYSFGIILHQILVQEGPFGITRLAKKKAEETSVNPNTSITSVRSITGVDSRTSGIEYWQPAYQDAIQSAIAGVKDSKLQKRPIVPKDGSDTKLNDDLKPLVKMMQRCWSEEPGARPEFPTITSEIKEIIKVKKIGNMMENLNKRFMKFSENLTAEVKKRTGDVVQYKAKYERLLQKTMPRDIALRLSNDPDCIKPKLFQDVTVYFDELSDFAKMASKMSPTEVVDWLEEIHEGYDQIVSLYQVQPLPMVEGKHLMVSSLGKKCSSSAWEVCLAALHLQLFIRLKRYREEKTSISSHMTTDSNLDAEPAGHQGHKQFDFKLKAGINTGCVSSALIGDRVPLFTVFGDTVNIAARMEQHGMDMRIQVSEATKDFLWNHPHYAKDGTTQYTADIEDRGQIEVKGKGPMTTYWLNSIEPCADRSTYNDYLLRAKMRIDGMESAQERRNTIVPVEQVLTKEPSLIPEGLGAQRPSWPTKLIKSVVSGFRRGSKCDPKTSSSRTLSSQTTNVALLAVIKQ